MVHTYLEVVHILIIHFCESSSLLARLVTARGWGVTARGQVVLNFPIITEPLNILVDSLDMPYFAFLVILSLFFLSLQCFEWNPLFHKIFRVYPRAHQPSYLGSLR